MYVILRGKVRVGRPAGPDRENLLTLSGPGELLGELTLFDPAPRKATATAITEVDIAVFTDTAVRDWLATDPGAAWPAGFAGLTTPSRICCSPMSPAAWLVPSSPWRGSSAMSRRRESASITT